MNSPGISILDLELLELEIITRKGGPGSGNWGHAGRPGSEGESLPRGSGTSKAYRGNVVTFDKTSHEGEINGIPIKHAEARDFGSIPDRVDEPPAPELLSGMNLSAGVVIVEDDGRIWVVEPEGHFGGYEHTFAKGRVEDGLTMQQTAMKEAYEEMGLNVQVTGYLRDAGGSTTVTRYYLAKRLDGDPADAHWETAQVKLATPDLLKKMLNVSRDRETLSLMLSQKGGPGSGNFGHRGRPGSEGGSVSRGVGAILEHFGPRTSDDVHTLADLEKFAETAGVGIGRGGRNNDRIPSEIEGIKIYTHETRGIAELRSIEENGLQVRSEGGKIFASQEIIREMSGNFVIFHGEGLEIPKEAVDFVESGLTFPEFQFSRSIPPENFVKIVRSVKDSTGFVIREDRLAKFALRNQGKDLPEIGNLPEKYQKWFDLAEKSAISYFKSLPHEDGEDDLRNRLEKFAEDKIYRAFRKVHAQIITTSNLDVDKAERALEESSSALRDALYEMFSSSTLAGAKAGQDQVDWLLGQRKATFDLQTSWDLVHVDALSWAGRFTARTLDGLNVTSSAAVATAVQNWINSGLPLSALDRSLEGIFGRARASLIATTEVTRAYARGSIVAWKRSGFITSNEWRTSEDELVCPVCGPLANRSTTLDQYFKDPSTGRNTEIWTPPAHPRCRCWLVPIITEPEIPADFKMETAEERAQRELEELIRRSQQTEDEELRFWPSDPNSLKFLRTLGGSTGAELVEDELTGRKFVRKHGNSPNHLLEEIMADEMYRAAGVNVPRVRLYTGTGPHGVMTKLSEFIEGQSLEDLRVSNPTRYNAARVELRKDFAMDAFLGNWDVIGMNGDNVLVDSAGKVWRIDNGGSLRYRAQGAKKTKFSHFITEFWTMRDPNVNASAATVFRGVEYDELITQMRRLLQSDIEDAIRDIPWKMDSGMTVVEGITDLSDAIRNRFYAMEELVRVFDDFTRKDNWHPEYVDVFSKHLQTLEDKEVFSSMAKSLKLGSPRSRYRLEDENGVVFDDLRNAAHQTVSRKFRGHLTPEESRALSAWAQEQAGSSWSDGAIAGKYRTMLSRTGQFSDYYWSQDVNTLASAKRKYDSFLSAQNISAADFESALAAQHALTYRIFTTMDLPNVDKFGRFVRQAIRTESWDVMSKYGFPSTPDDVWRYIERGVVESASLVEPFSYQGHHITIQEVPLSRVIGSYLTASPSNQYHGLFAGDGENEIVVIFEGINSKYLGTMNAVKVTIQ